jgi:hypothetical protein
MTHHVPADPSTPAGLTADPATEAGAGVDPSGPAARTAPSAEPSPLDAVGSAFTALVTGPRPLAVDGAAIGAGLPVRLLDLDEVRSLLLHPATSYETRDLVWAHVVTRAKAGDPAWLIGAVGLGLPGLRRMAARLAARMPRYQVPDLEAEMLTGYLTALKAMELETGRIASRLCWAAYRAADRYRASDPARSGVVTPMAGSMPPPRPWGHPDFVLARAVTDGILSDYEAELIARTRLEHRTLNSLAAEWGLPVSTLADDRARAEDRLVEVLDPTRHSRPAKITDRSRSGTGPEISAQIPDSEDEGQAQAAPADPNPTLLPNPTQARHRAA